MADAASKTGDIICELNDAFRQTFTGGLVVLTDGVASFRKARAAILLSVRTFTDFSLENDPFGEHDFGALEHDGLRLFWKIDCYDRSMAFGSPDPAAPNLTCRVLTVMRADEY